MRESHLPFRADKTLKSEIKYKYIMPALQWLCHGTDTHRVIAMELGSNWAVGYTIICVLTARDLFISDASFPGQFDGKLDAAVQYLISRVSWEKETCHWDGVLYDTAIILRALILYRRTIPHSNHLKRMNEIIHKSAYPDM